MSEKQLSFEGAMKIVNGNKWIKLKDIEKLSDFIQEQQATIEQLQEELELTAKNKLFSRRKLEEENEQLRQQLQEYKENWDDMVELGTKTSLRNVELDEQIGQLRKQVAECKMILRQHEFAKQEGFK